MAPTRLSLKRMLLLSTILVLALFSAQGFAQNDDDDDSTSATAAATTAEETSKAAATTATADNTDDATTTANTTPKITNTNTADDTSATGETSLPQITGTSGTSATGSTGSLTLPTLSKTVDTAIPTYPAASVPPTTNAPFMHQSTAPDGTVFIAVGAILGAFGLAILLWRAIVACLLHRSVERAALNQHLANDKAFPAPPAPFYKYSDRDSSPTLASANAGRGVRRTTRGPIPSATPSQTNLFFSPTASAGAGMNTSNRDSRFLPSGFYAAGSASPANAHGHSISLTNLRPDSRGHARAYEPSPPESPSMGPTRTPQQRNVSSSSLNLYRPPSGRAPSAFLDDLLDDQPGMFPPAGQMPPQNPHHGHTQSQGRF